MSKITTEYCKEYLINHFNEKNIISTEKEWKRTKKYKNNEGLWIRDFEHSTIGVVSLSEKDGSLEIYQGTHLSSVSNDKRKLTENVVNLTQFSPQQLKIGLDTYSFYYNNNGDDVPEDEDPQEDAWVKKNYSKIQFIPSLSGKKAENLFL